MRTVCRVIAALTVWYAGVVLCVAADEAGVVVGVQGEVSVVSGGAKQAARNGQLLKPGDTVASGGGTASVVLTSGATRVLKKGDSFTLPAGKVAPDPAIARVMKAIGEISAKDDGPTVKGMVRTEPGAFVLLAPRNTFLTADTPKFEWKGDTKNAELEIFVKAPEPEYRHSFKVPSRTNSAAMPGDAPPLKPGVKYYWKVRAQQEGDEAPRESNLCWFGVLSPEDAAGVAAALKTIGELTDLPAGQKTFIEVHCLLSYGLNRDAINKIDDALKADPKDEALAALRKRVEAGAGSN